MTARLRPGADRPRRFETRLPSSSQRLSSYVVVRIEKSSPAVDGKGNLVPSTWDKASHMIQKDISQQDAKHKVRELDRETGCVSDKKRDLSSALQQQLERAHTRLENMESDRRYIYKLVQLDWKFKRVETSGEYHGRRDKYSNDRKRDKERHRSRPRKERVSVTAYFKREPSSNENCLKMYRRQQGDNKRDGSQLSSSKMERQHTSGSQNSRSSTASFDSFSGKHSNDNLTPNSSVDDISSHRHYEEGRGRSRYRQSRNGEAFEIEIARPKSRRNSMGRHDRISPPVPDPTKPEPKPATDSLRRMEPRAYGEGISRSRSVKDSSRQLRFAQNTLEKQRDSLHHVSYYSSSGEDVKQLGGRLRRISLADEPRSDCREAETYREPLRQYHDDKAEELAISEPSDIVWRKQDAQRYMNDRRRFDQDAWDLGRSGPLLYAESGRV